MNWLRRILCKDKSNNADEALIAKDDRWVLCVMNGDPFGRKPYRPVKILDVREGWVRYDMGSGGPFRDERMKVIEFVKMYQLFSRE